MPEGATMVRLQQHYRETVAPKLREQFNYRNIMEVPRITKVTLNMGVGEAVADKKIMEHAVSNLTQIAGQKPVVTLSRKSIAGFKIREGWPIGCKVTLRRERMYEFLDRLINIAIPRIRDFRGFSGRAFDGRGNYSLGVREQIIFPEIDYDKIDTIRGLDITITTNARTDEEGRALLAAFNFPFRN
ncbi:50S ribosomal subunit protein L5 [Candidatus Competibacter denitrificans Run_A_D11]|jgi:large subunit ribosomal protein L5|uniref:Large ribosomal subunit protein uL5 n=2 Tax=Candidatus Competibacter TaxID=221279 RepID=W6M323_9GAMM|nr:50S ribosomal subunit protein L5 [Candidatus Competibacter denitrificans Run_A_D11]